MKCACLLVKYGPYGGEILPRLLRVEYCSVHQCRLSSARCLCEMFVSLWSQKYLEKSGLKTCCWRNQHSQIKLIALLPAQRTLAGTQEAKKLKAGECITGSN